jgi:hypothetical protein
MPLRSQAAENGSTKSFSSVPSVTSTAIHILPDCSFRDSTHCAKCMTKQSTKRRYHYPDLQ